MSWKWYGVKTAYRTTAVGEPRNVDRYYDPEATLVEERVVLFRARSFDEALAKAEQEALRYVDSDRFNRYSQRLRKRFLGRTNAFELFEAPGAGVEAFSLTEVVAQTVSDHEVRLNRMGRERRRDKWRRTKMLQKEFISAPGRRAL